MSSLETRPAREPPWPLVSVVLPTRGRPDLVRDALGSVLRQSYPGKIECVVVHDQETPDRSLADVLAIAQRIAPQLANDDDVQEFAQLVAKAMEVHG